MIEAVANYYLLLLIFFFPLIIINFFINPRHVHLWLGTRWRLYGKIFGKRLEKMRKAVIRSEDTSFTGIIMLTISFSIVWPGGCVPSLCRCLQPRIPNNQVQHGDRRKRDRLPRSQNLDIWWPRIRDLQEALQYRHRDQQFYVFPNFAQDGSFL